MSINVVVFPTVPGGDGVHAVLRFKVASVSWPKLRVETIYDTSRVEDPMSPRKIEFLRESGGEGDGTAPSPAGHFECNILDFIHMDDRRRDVEEMLASVGFPLQDALIVSYFLFCSASHVSNNRWRVVAVKVVLTAAPRRSTLLQTTNDVAAADEKVDAAKQVCAACLGEDVSSQACAICLEECVVGGGTAVRRLSCSHAYHEKCLQRWLRRSRTCPYCRAPARPGDDHELSYCRMHAL